MPRVDMALVGHASEQTQHILLIHKVQKAVAALVAAKKLSDNATLVENCDRLVNGKLKHFSNAGFGDAWYSLYLEEPKIKPQRQVVRGY